MTKHIKFIEVLMFWSYAGPAVKFKHLSLHSSWLLPLLASVLLLRTEAAGLGTVTLVFSRFYASCVKQDTLVPCSSLQAPVSCL